MTDPTKQSRSRDGPDTTVLCTFAWPYDARASVAIAGSFNFWVPQPMTPQKDRKWESRVPLRLSQTPHFYKFVVDGQWFWDVKKPTAKDAFGNTNNIVDANALVREEAIFREDAHAAGDSGARWLVKAADAGGRWRWCSPEVASALERVCQGDTDRVRVAPRTDVTMRRRYIGGDLVCEFAQVEAGSSIPIRPVGAFPFRVLKPIHDCGYGLDDEEEIQMVTAFSRRNSRDLPHPQSAPSAPTKGFSDLPDSVVLCILSKLLSVCTCPCHDGQICADSAVYSLCTMELVSKRFHEPKLDLSLAEQAARGLCIAVNPRFLLRRRCWKEALLDLDPKTEERERIIKRELHLVAYRKKPDGKWLNDEVSRAVALAEIKRKWPSRDTTLIEEIEAL